MGGFFHRDIDDVIKFQPTFSPPFPLRKCRLTALFLPRHSHPWTLPIFANGISQLCFGQSYADDRLSQWALTWYHCRNHQHFSRFLSSWSWAAYQKCLQTHSRTPVSKINSFSMNLRCVRLEKVSWDAKCYLQKLPKTSFKEGSKAAVNSRASLRKQYPPLPADDVNSCPCIIVDMHGVILAWYLPGALSKYRQVGLLFIGSRKHFKSSQGKMMAATEKLKSPLSKSLTGTCWRSKSSLFRESIQVPTGVLNFSSGWFEQGHAVSSFLYIVTVQRLILTEEMVQLAPQVSKSLKSPEASVWLDEISESNLISSAILGVIHPWLYGAGLETLTRLRQSPQIQCQDVLAKWTSVFNGVSVICNRLTPEHRDAQSRHHWYDLVMSLGPYRNSNFELPELGISLAYNPGTVIGLSGKMLEHAVPCFDGERVCYTYFMRDNVHEWAGVDGGTWMKTDYYASDDCA